jgi:exocyst complex component 2
MAMEITDSLTNLLSTFFSLSDDPQSPSLSLPQWLLPYTNSFTDAHFLSAILSSLSDSTNDINQVLSEILQGDQKNALKTLLESLRWKFGELLAKVWKNGD